MIHHPTFDNLRASSAEPHYFGLGFIQLKLGPDRRMHFWHPEISPTVDEDDIHDHRYSFTSTVLVGSVRKTIYNFVLGNSLYPAGNTHELVATNCQKDDFPERLGFGRVYEQLSMRLAERSSYTIAQDTFHRQTADRAVTYVTRPDEASVPKARVLRRIGAPHVCPFESKLPQKRLWEIIEDLYGDFDPVEFANGARTKASIAEPEPDWAGREIARMNREQEAQAPGYHLTAIEKGELGEPSKLLEEIHEIIDARKQGVKVMELVEMSDLYGAMQAMLTRHHPGYSMDDLKEMAMVTKRAFDNGRR